MNIYIYIMNIHIYIYRWFQPSGYGGQFPQGLFCHQQMHFFDYNSVAAVASSRRGFFVSQKCTFFYYNPVATVASSRRGFFCRPKMHFLIQNPVATVCSSRRGFFVTKNDRYEASLGQKPGFKRVPPSILPKDRTNEKLPYIYICPRCAKQELDGG